MMGSLGLAELARQQLLAHGVAAATAVLETGLADNPDQCKSWLLLGDLLSRSREGTSDANPSGRQSEVGEPRRAAEAYLAACQCDGDVQTHEAAHENLQRLVRRCLGCSPSVLLESFWNMPRNRFVTTELRRAAALPEAATVALVVDGAGWEAVWIAKNTSALAVYSVRGRTSLLAPFEAALSIANEAAVMNFDWRDVGTHMGLLQPMPRRALVVLGSCLSAHPISPNSVLSVLGNVKSLLGDMEVVWIPGRIVWRGGWTSSTQLDGCRIVDAKPFIERGLDYSVAVDSLLPHHHWVELSNFGAGWPDEHIGCLNFEDAWRSPVQDNVLSIRAIPTPQTANDIFVWWTSAEVRSAVEGEQLQTHLVACGPCCETMRTWQVAVFATSACSDTRRLLDAVEVPLVFRSYHTSMLNDNARTAYYDAAIATAVRSKDAVPLVGLDLGAGTGVLSMLLAKHVETTTQCHVVAVEGETRLAGLAQKLVEANSLDHRVLVVPQLSTAMQELPGGRRANFCVHEIFGSDPLSERVLPSLRHARANLMEFDVTLVPSHFKLLCALCAGNRLSKLFSAPSVVEGVPGVGVIFGHLAPVVEVAALPAFLERTVVELGPTADRNAAEFVWLSRAVEVGTFDLRTLPDEVPVQRNFKILGDGVALPSEVVGGVFLASWFRLDGDPALDTGPGQSSPSRPWAQCVQPVSAARDAFGQPFEAEFVVRLTDDRVRYKLERVVLPDEEETCSLGSLFDET